MPVSCCTKAVLWSFFAVGISLSNAFAQTIDGVSAATRQLYPDRPFRIGLIELSDSHKVTGLVAKSVKELRKAFYPYQINIQQFSSGDLENAIRNNEVDAFIASSGFYWRMVPFGARDVATMISRNSPDPNHTSAITFITSRDNTSIRTLADMQGKRLSASYPTAFMGYRIGLAEIASHGYDPEKFFSSVTFNNAPGIDPIAQKVLTGQADVAFVQSCWLETLPKEKRDLYRVISPIKDAVTACVRSTAAYPNITVAVLREAPAGAAREIAKVLLSMPVDENGEHWGLATNFQSVDRVYKLLKLEHYAYLREWSVKRWIAAHKPWIAAFGFCLVLLICHSFVVGYLVRRRTDELAKANAEKEAVERRLQSLYERMEKFRKANTVSQLSSMIAHELAQPIGAAVSYCNGLKLLVQNKTLTQDKLLNSINGLDRGLTRVRNIIEKVRSYNKGNVDRDQKLNLLRTVTTARDSMSQQLVQALPIEISVADNLSVLGDQLELELLFNNLLSNAVTAAVQTPEALVNVSAVAASDKVLVTVENSGKEISESDLTQLSTPFVSERGSGHGLGVPISMSLAEANGGHLKYTRRPAGGLIAQVTLRSVT